MYISITDLYICYLEKYYRIISSSALWHSMACNPSYIIGIPWVPQYFLPDVIINYTKTHPLWCRQGKPREITFIMAGGTMKTIGGITKFHQPFGGDHKNEGTNYGSGSLNHILGYHKIWLLVRPSKIICVFQVNLFLKRYERGLKQNTNLKKIHNVNLAEYYSYNASIFHSYNILRIICYISWLENVLW